MGDNGCIPGCDKTKRRRLVLELVGGWTTNKHRGFEVDCTEPGETFARKICRTFLTIQDVTSQPARLVNILFVLTRHLFHNKTWSFLLNATVFLKTT